MTNWLSQFGYRRIYRLTPCDDSVVQLQVWDAKMARRLRDGHPLSVDIDVDVPAGVIRLLPTRGPSAIGWLVVAVIVDAIQRVIRRRSLTHVEQECRVGLLPSLAHRNASASIVWPRRNLWIEAAADDVAPDSVLRRHCAMGGLSMCSPVWLFAKQASAALRVAAERVSANCRSVAAVADAGPRPRAVWSALSFSLNHQSPDSLTNHFNLTLETS